jgi:isoleucyl-tRNA synthetase
LWVASVDFREDVVGSERLMLRIAENYRTIRNNLFRYVLGNLYDFDPGKDSLPFDRLETLDQYILRQTAAMAVDVQRWYGEFAFHKVYQRVLNFCTVELSAFYFDVIKDRLYTYAPNSPGRRAAQTAIWRIGEALVRLLAPVMSFTCEEVWGYLPGNRAQTVHAAQFPGRTEVLGSDDVVDDAKQLEDWSTLLLVRDQVLKALETARNNKLIGKSLEAEVTISATEPVYGILERQREQLRYLFIVSTATLEKAASGNGTGNVAVQVGKAAGRKCDRCWNYSTRVGEDPVYPTVCERCSAVLKEIESGSGVI